VALHEFPIAHSMCSDVLAEAERAIGGELLRLSEPKMHRSARPTLLDVGCWDGAATARYSKLISADACGLEVFTPQVKEAKARGVEVAQIDLERDSFPWSAQTFNFIVANQVFEHLKNIWLPLSEIYRTLKPGGHFIISVPNLASLHNRLFLLAGVQPTSIRVLGPHVRGYTVEALRSLLSLDGAMTCRRVRGVGFYPFPAKVARGLCALFPSASHTMVLTMEKTTNNETSPWHPLGPRYTDIAAQTHYDATAQVRS
jgi:SAM-dependent methyltransferase